ncbi:EAL domain-containing protein [Pluralibacter gergoviae]|uniref:EAL domain-containing protein n=1 Tax=Pluralibacter gergoviae TaxID=61647 RepID=UPI002EDA13BF
MALMTFYKKSRDKWWGLPLLLPLVLLPLTRFANTFSQFEGGTATLYYLPLAFMLSMIFFFGWQALPGMILGAWVVMGHGMTTGEKMFVIIHFLVPSILSWGGYRAFVTRRHQISYSTTWLMPQRMFWQVFFPASLFQLLLMFAIFLGMLPEDVPLTGAGALTLNSLVNYQALLVGCMTGVPISYLAIRIIRHPQHLRAYCSQLRHQIDSKVSRSEMACWALALLFILLLLLAPSNGSGSIFMTNYTLSLLLPVMLWGAMRFGYRLISVIWTLVLIVAVHFYYRYIPFYPNYSNQLAITSSSYLIFSFIIAYMALLATQQRVSHARAQRMAFIDPVVHLPNLWALSRHIAATPWSILGFIRVPELEVLGRNYGMMFRIQYKQALAKWLEPQLQAGEQIYHLSGHDLAIRLNTEAHDTRIDMLYSRLKRFRFMWDGMPQQPNIGVSYCHVRSPVQHLPMLLGELSTIANLSLVTGVVESLQHRNAMHLQQRQRIKVNIMNRIQMALDNDGFCLMAQPVSGIRGDNFYEVLLRLKGDDGETIMPDDFFPIAHEFGLASRIDLWVLENTLRFMDGAREALPGLQLSVNISPASACGARFPDTVTGMLARYGIEPWQLIIEITENQSMTYPEQALDNIEILREAGCRIAIDDFGSGYASYARLKKLSADILKIDGSFIQNLLKCSLDYQIVSSICHLARMKRMRVVAEYVESEEICDAVVALGIDYLQGYYIGKPAPLQSLVANSSDVP